MPQGTDTSESHRLSEMAPFQDTIERTPLTPEADKNARIEAAQLATARAIDTPDEVPSLYDTQEAPHMTSPAEVKAAIPAEVFAHQMGINVEALRAASDEEFGLAS